MIRTGLLNPHISALLARVRHTNMLVIADRGFPFWPSIETIDISLTDDLPTVLQVLAAIRLNFDISEIFMAREFQFENTPSIQQQFAQATSGIPVRFEPHADLKKKVPGAIGLVRTADTVQYANMILVSGRVAAV